MWSIVTMRYRSGLLLRSGLPGGVTINSGELKRKGKDEWEMEVAKFKGWKREPIDLKIDDVPLPDTRFAPRQGEMQGVRATSSGPKRPVLDIKNRRESAAQVTPLHSNPVGQYNEGAPDQMAEHLNRKGRATTSITSILSIWSQHQKLQTESSKLAPGTGVYYKPRRSITSTGYVNAYTLEALSLLAEVSCVVKRTHLQRSCNLTPQLSQSEGQVKACTIEALSLLADVSCEVMKRPRTPRSCSRTPKPSVFNGENMKRLNRTPLQKKMASVLRNLNQLKEQCADRHSEKVTDSLRVVRKLRTPRRPSLSAISCPTKLRKNISLSECDENFSHKWESSGAGLAVRVRLREPVAVTDTSVITSEAKKDIIMLGEGRILDEKPISNTVSVPAQRTATLERVSKSSSQVSGTKIKSFGGSRRKERFTNQILQFIGEVPVPEKVIRQTLGNNPDTSKALRLLLAERKVKRLGLGGRGRPYEYKATEIGLRHIQDKEEAVSAGVELTPENCVSSCDPISGPTTVSDAPKSEAAQRLLPTQDTINPEVSLSHANESRLYSVTPHCCLEWPRTQSLTCVLSSQSLDFPSRGITEC